MTASQVLSELQMEQEQGLDPGPQILQLSQRQNFSVSIESFRGLPA